MTKSAEVVNKQTQPKTNAVSKPTDAGKSLPSATNFEVLSNYDTASSESSEVAQKKSSPYWSHQSNSAAGSNGQSPAQLAAVEPNKTGLPDNIKSGAEHLSGMSLSDVNVHYNSDKPAQLAAHAYAQGTDIHVAPGQEKHVAHEAWHVVQQKQGRVNATTQMKATTPVNDDAGLESEADRMGAKSAAIGSSIQAKAQLKKNESINNQKTVQRAGPTADPKGAEVAEKEKDGPKVELDEENSLELNEDGGTMNIMGYSVSYKSTKGAKEVELAMPEISLPPEGDWGAKIDIPIPIDPTGLAAINVGIGVGGSLKLKPSFKAIREKTPTSTKYTLSGDAKIDGEIFVEATAGVSVGSSFIAKAEAGVFAKGSILLEDSGLNITGIYEKFVDGKAGNLQASIAANVKGSLVATVGGFIEGSMFFGAIKKTKKYELGKWKLGEIDKTWSTAISSEGMQWPKFKDLYKPTDDKPEIKNKEEEEEKK
jgi:hypothetical protein